MPNVCATSSSSGVRVSLAMTMGNTRSFPCSSPCPSARRAPAGTPSMCHHRSTPFHTPLRSAPAVRGDSCCARRVLACNVEWIGSALPHEAEHHLSPEEERCSQWLYFHALPRTTAELFTISHCVKMSLLHLPPECVSLVLDELIASNCTQDAFSKLADQTRGMSRSGNALCEGIRASTRRSIPYLVWQVRW